MCFSTYTPSSPSSSERSSPSVDFGSTDSKKPVSRCMQCPPESGLHTTPLSFSRFRPPRIVEIESLPVFRKEVGIHNSHRHQNSKLRSRRTEHRQYPNPRIPTRYRIAIVGSPENIISSGTHRHGNQDPHIFRPWPLAQLQRIFSPGQNS